MSVIVVFKIRVTETAAASHLQERDEEKEGIGCPPELRVEEAGKEGEDIIFGRAGDGTEQQTRPRVEEGDKRKRGRQMVSSQCLGGSFYTIDIQNTNGSENNHHILSVSENIQQQISTQHHGITHSLPTVIASAVNASPCESVCVSGWENVVLETPLLVGMITKVYFFVSIS